MNRRGFTFIELMVVITILGILANAAVLALTTLRLRADAAHVIGDYEAVRVAAFDAFAATNAFPPTAACGQVPLGLAGSLPAGFAFSYKSLTYCWRRWALPNGMPTNPSQSVLLGLELQSNDVNLMAAITSAFRSGVAFGTPTAVTLVIQ